MFKLSRLCSIMMVFFCISIMTVPANAADKLTVAVNQSRVLIFNGVQKVAVANPDIADVVVVSDAEVLLVGKKAGNTSLHTWSKQGRISYLVEVGIDDTYAAEEIKAALGYPDVRIRKIGRTILLEGTVNDQYQKNRAGQVAGIYGETVVNLLEIKQPIQIKIEAKIIEIDRQKSKEMGIKWGNGIGTGFSAGSFSFGQSFFNPTGGGVPFGKLGGYADVNAQLSALVKNGYAKILSQPNMITLSGEKADIMVGGQIPVPVSVQGNQIGIEWKDYGIKLEIAPNVDAQGLINSKVKAEVSSLDWNSTHKIQLGTNMYIPPIKLRKAETAIALPSGETLAIGGLISSEITKDIYKVPLLANIPVIGSLFKSTSFEHNETELVILITPTVVGSEYQPQVNSEMKSFMKEKPRE